MINSAIGQAKDGHVQVEKSGSSATSLITCIRFIQKFSDSFMEHFSTSYLYPFRYIFNLVRNIIKVVKQQKWRKVDIAIRKDNR